jgi:hypothetical protein
LPLPEYDGFALRIYNLNPFVCFVYFVVPKFPGSAFVSIRVFRGFLFCVFCVFRGF